MKERLWFKTRRSGWGWYPATWQAWLTLAIYVGLIAGGTWVLLPHLTADALQPLRLLIWLFFIALTIVSLLAVAWRTGSTPRVGGDDNDKDTKE